MNFTPSNIQDKTKSPDGTYKININRHSTGVECILTNLHTGEVGKLHECTCIGQFRGWVSNNIFHLICVDTTRHFLALYSYKVVNVNCTQKLHTTIFSNCTKLTNNEIQPYSNIYAQYKTVKVENDDYKYYVPDPWTVLHVIKLELEKYVIHDLSREVIHALYGIERKFID